MICRQEECEQDYCVCNVRSSVFLVLHKFKEVCTLHVYVLINLVLNLNDFWREQLLGAASVTNPLARLTME